MAIAHFRMLNNEFFNKYPVVVPEESPPVILDKNQLSAWIIMVRKPNTLDTLTE